MEKGVSVTIDDYHESDDPLNEEMVKNLLIQMCLSLANCNLDPDKWQIYADSHNIAADNLLEVFLTIDSYHIIS